MRCACPHRILPPPLPPLPGRRLDLGRARAFADAIDLAPLQAVRDALGANLQQLLAFEQVGVGALAVGRQTKGGREGGLSARKLVRPLLRAPLAVGCSG